MDENRKDSCEIDDEGDCEEIVPNEFAAPLSPRILEELIPSETLQGTSGVYLLSNSRGEGVAVFKPLDEERVPEDVTKWALVSGQCAPREEAAYAVSSRILGGYSGVPHTTVMKVRTPHGERLGSVQRYVPSSIDMSDRGPSGISANEVHKIGCLDILLFNVDRHEGNVLLRKSSNPNHRGSSQELFPIDHGLCLPEIVSPMTGPNLELLQNMYFAWQTWPQAKKPFLKCVKKMLEKQLSKEVFPDLVRGLMEELGSEKMKISAFTTLRVGALVLRETVKAGMNLYEIANFVRSTLPTLMSTAWEESRHAKQVEWETSTATEKDSDSRSSLPCFEKNAMVVYKNEPNQTRENCYKIWEAQFLSELEILMVQELQGKGGSEVIEGKDTVSSDEKESIFISAVQREPLVCHGSAVEELDTDGIALSIDKDNLSREGREPLSPDLQAVDDLVDRLGTVDLRGDEPLRPSPSKRKYLLLKPSVVSKRKTAKDRRMGDERRKSGARLKLLRRGWRNLMSHVKWCKQCRKDAAGLLKIWRMKLRGASRRMKIMCQSPGILLAIWLSRLSRLSNFPCLKGFTRAFLRTKLTV
uniref:PI3K/PI4K catalytic domain-containing protein n=1 Tax=Guillardia theta TaxID=55529 RepID=A0A7S4JAQ5_GUITH|mmetsp:Transcript_14624/g.49926  ORF Transcript_14624/g.49926 Transcript_14624/m.49926 type:complete len:585 (+) Transcript_14624:590-2344(+)